MTPSVEAIKTKTPRLGLGHDEVLYPSTEQNMLDALSDDYPALSPNKLVKSPSKSLRNS